MASWSSDFLQEVVFFADSSMAVIDADMLRNEEELNFEKNSCIKNMISKKKSSFPCEFSDEIFWSSGYLKRYFTKKQPSLKALESSTSDCFGSDLVPKLALSKFKKGRNNILAQLLDISIQKQLCFEFE